MGWRKRNRGRGAESGGLRAEIVFVFLRKVVAGFPGQRLVVEGRADSYQC